MIKVCQECYINSKLDPMFCVIVEKVKCQCHCKHDEQIKRISRENARLIAEYIWQEIYREILEEEKNES